MFLCSRKYDDDDEEDHRTLTEGAQARSQWLGETMCAGASALGCETGLKATRKGASLAQFAFGGWR
jgi:hypothetical protein